jgi:hypothetical protein
LFNGLFKTITRLWQFPLGHGKSTFHFEIWKMASCHLSILIINILSLSIDLKSCLDNIFLFIFLTNFQLVVFKFISQLYLIEHWPNVGALKTMNQTMNHHKIISINIFHGNMYYFQIFQKLSYLKNVPKGHNIDGICISNLL